jgi:hypothetical protein
MVEPDRTMSIDVGENVEIRRGTIKDAVYSARISLPTPGAWVRLWCAERLDPAHTPGRVSSVGRPDQTRLHSPDRTLTRADQGR